MVKARVDDQRVLATKPLDNLVQGHSNLIEANWEEYCQLEIYMAQVRYNPLDNIF